MKHFCLVIFIAIAALLTMTAGTTLAEDYQTQCCPPLPPPPPPPPPPPCPECSTYTGEFSFGGSTYLTDHPDTPRIVASGGYDGAGSFDVTTPNTTFYGEVGGEGYSESWTEEWCNGRKVIQNSGGKIWVKTE